MQSYQPIFDSKYADITSKQIIKIVKRKLRDIWEIKYLNHCTS